MRRFLVWGLGLTAVLLVGVSLIALPSVKAAPLLSPPAAPPMQAGGESPCFPDVGKIASPKVILLGETVDITLTVRAVCAGERFPLHIVLVLDGSGSMAGTPNQQLKQAASTLVRGLDMNEYPATKVGVVEFNSTARTLSPLTNVENRAIGAINRIGANGGTRIDAGILEGMRVLRQGRGDEKDITEVMVVLSDGGNNAGCQPVLQAAGQARGQGILMISICVGSGCDEQCMRQVASSPRYYFRAENASALQGIFTQIRDRILNINLKKLVVKDTLPSYMEFVKDSAEPEQSSPDDPTQWLQWDDVYIPKDGTTYTFKVRPLQVGYMPTNLEARGVLTDNKGRSKEWLFPIPWVTVLQPRALITPETPPTPIPTVTLTPTPTPTITPSPTVTPSPTITPSPTPTPTPRPKPIYLPILLRERCKGDVYYPDVVLVLDMSTSMRFKTPSGRTKLEAVLDAADHFLSLMDYTPNDDGRRAQGAVAGFNSEMWIQQPLTNDEPALHRAVRDLPNRMKEGTRLDLAFIIGAQALADPRHDPWNDKVMIMLTDGLPNKIPLGEDGTMEMSVRNAATAAKVQDIRIFTIGFGYDDPSQPLVWQINRKLLTETASAPTDFFLDPTGNDLTSIYSQIWATLDPCGGVHDWGKPWPPVITR